jgi:hypothetical protein
MAPQEPEEGECTGAVKRRKAAAATDVSMELDILDCPVCYHPYGPRSSRYTRVLRPVLTEFHQSFMDINYTDVALY